jgi:hypothetical protein
VAVIFVVGVGGVIVGGGGGFFLLAGWTGGSVGRTALGLLRFGGLSGLVKVGIGGGIGHVDVQP